MVAEAEPSAPSRERAVWEKEVLGFQFGDHPFLEASAWLAGRVTHDTSQLTPEAAGERVTVAGVVTGVRRLLTKTKSQMAVLLLEDLHGSIEAVVFPRVYERTAEQTAVNDGMTLCLAVNYGGRTEISDAARRLAEDVQAGRVEPDQVD